MVGKNGKVGKGNEVHVYLLHFEEPIGEAQSDADRARNNPQRQWLPPRQKTYKAHAQHYVGATHDLGERLHEHATGNGSKLLAAVRKNGTRFALAKVWYGGGWETEQRIKRQKNHKRYCPICRGEQDFVPFDEDRLDEILPTVADPFWPW